ncbi:hypothetical protein [Nocardioides soli]|uniref:Uncharacterized protein n=1 Tax=Nocardioides soli TaxID=1036020 RepID=A0A7W4VTV3_9ACTN|nr:hypothetical protein [Nocardioides soli]MBB3041247.1 hypothetical protein [Nocardioides soli]
MNLQVRVSHAIVVAIAALALIAGVGAAGAVAGAKWIDGKRIEPNSIPANRLQKGTLTGKQLKKGAIKGNAIAKRSIRATQIAPSTITTNELDDGTVDELKPTVEYVDNVITGSIDNSAYYPAPCPVGTQAVAGYVKPGGSGLVSFVNSYIDPEQNALMVQFSISGTANVQTICLR